MICGFWQKAVPPPHTSHRPSTQKHVWLCVSSTAPGTEWLKTHRDNQLKRNSTFPIDHIRLDIRVDHIRSDQRLTPDSHEHSESYSALIVKQMADLCGYKHIMNTIKREDHTSGAAQTQINSRSNFSENQCQLVCGEFNDPSMDPTYTV